MIAAALRDLAAIEEVEVVIVARGGGSLADLFAFCDEALCRTVALLRVPVISSVGHHTDRTLIDDVAAVGCSTPTHAAEAAVPIDCHAARDALRPRHAAARPRPPRRSPNAPGRSQRSGGRRAEPPRRPAASPAPPAPARASGQRAAWRGQATRARRRSREGARSRHRARPRRPSAPPAGASSTVSRSPWPLTTPNGRWLAATPSSRTAPAERLASAAAAREAGEVRLRFHDGTLPATVTDES